MSNVVPGVSLTPEQEKTAFYRRWDEFRNIVAISYSTPEDDATVTVYDVSGAGAGGGPPWLWCPVQCDGVPLESWQDYPERKREAIRRGFMHGLCNMIGRTPPDTLADWQRLRPDLCQPCIYDRHVVPMITQVVKNENFAAGITAIEKLLTTIYAAGVQIPFHPNFENELAAHLGRVPLTGVDAFLAGFAHRKGLATPEGYTYLLNVAIPLAEAPEAGRRTVMERVVSWLRLALDTPAAPAIAEPSQPGSPAPDKGCTHLGYTFNTAPAPPQRMYQNGTTLDTAAPTVAAVLTVADLCREGFTPADVLALAREVGLADEAGRFCLWARKPGTKPRKLGAVVGFCKALGGDAKGVTAPPLAGTIPERVRAVGVLLDVEIHTTKTGTGVAEKYRKATERALARRKPTH